MQRRRLTALLALLALVALPGTALAQSAGDEQYQDPFAQSEEPAPDQGGSGGEEDSGGGVAQPAPEAAPAAPAQTEAPAGTQTLPRTGFPAVLAAAIGMTLLAAGAALRLMAWSPPRGGRGGMLSLTPGAPASARPAGRAARASRAARARARRRAWRT